MTKMHFIALAARIRDGITMGISLEEARFAAQVIIDVASAANPRFDRARFLKACGL